MDPTLPDKVGRVQAKRKLILVLAMLTLSAVVVLHSMTTIIGIDPGLAHCGIARLVWSSGLRAWHVHSVVVLETLASKGATIGDRLREHAGDLWPYLTWDGGDLLQAPVADYVIAEYPSFPPSAAAAAMLFASFGAISAYAGDRLVTYATPTWRRALGLDARAEKKMRKRDVREAMEKRWGALPGLADIVTGCHEHAYDALGVATAWIDAPRLGKYAEGKEPK